LSHLISISGGDMMNDVGMCVYIHFTNRKQVISNRNTENISKIKAN
jgi:hypothetical protein